MKQTKQSRTRRFSDAYWEWFEAKVRPSYEITGKYLFFSPDRELLVAIALAEIAQNGFHLAKTHAKGVVPPSGDYVLCLYFADDTRKRELAAKYKGREGLRYRYWKSDEGTTSRKYSNEFLDKLSPEDRKHFEGE